MTFIFALITRTVSARRLLAFSAVAAILASVPVNAASDSKLRAVRGTVGYQVAKDAPFSRVFGSYVVADNQYAITQAASNGLLQLADSSEVALGESTTIQVGAITQAATATAPTAMTLVAGAVRFAIKHPAGQPSNYRFQSVTSQLAVRGTTGLYSTGPTGDVVTCLDCAPGDVTVTAGGNSFPLLTGQTATISLAGVVTIATTVALVTTAFANAGLSTSANSATAFAPGINTATPVGAHVSAAAIAGGAAAAAGIGIGVSRVTSGGPNTIPVTTGQPGNLGISSRIVAPAPTSSPATPLSVRR
jgi:hypothetical protein